MTSLSASVFWVYEHVLYWLAYSLKRCNWSFSSDVRKVTLLYTEDFLTRTLANSDFPDKIRHCYYLMYRSKMYFYWCTIYCSKTVIICEFIIVIVWCHCYCLMYCSKDVYSVDSLLVLPDSKTVIIVIAWCNVPKMYFLVMFYYYYCLTYYSKTVIFCEFIIVFIWCTGPKMYFLWIHNYLFLTYCSKNVIICGFIIVIFFNVIVIVWCIVPKMYFLVMYNTWLLFQDCDYLWVYHCYCLIYCSRDVFYVDS